MRHRRTAVVALLFATACTAQPTAVPTPSPSPSSTPTPTPSVSRTPAPVRFSADRAVTSIRDLVARAPRREASSAAYRRAAGIMASRLEDLGYVVRRQSFPVPAGTCDGIAVPAGRSQNVVATPRGFDPAEPHLVVGGHLDTVPDTPGANDNASGMGVLLELARLATIRPPRTPIVWVAFGAEERRRGPGLNASSLGSREYLRRMSDAEERSLAGMVNLDMVGAGRDVKIIGGRGRIVAELQVAARRVRVPYEFRTSIANGFSDHQQFQRAGYSVGWLWAGDHPTLHTPSDGIAVIQRAEITRVGRVAWEMLRTFRG